MAAYDAIIATIVVASDASSVTKAMVNSTTWRAGTSGDWLSTSCTLTAGNTYQFRTENSNFGSSTATLPNIEASVTVDWDTSGTVITTFGNFFMFYYAYYCTSLTSLSVPDTSSVTSIGNQFMTYYADSCSSLTRLELPAVGWFETHNINWMIPSGRLNHLKGYVKNSTDLSDWQALTVSGKTLYTNYIRRTSDVILEEEEIPDEPDPVTRRIFIIN